MARDKTDKTDKTDTIPAAKPATLTSKGKQTAKITSPDMETILAVNEALRADPNAEFIFTLYWRTRTLLDEPPPVLSVASVLSEGGWPAPSRAHGLEPDPSAYLDLLRHHGPATYGAMADALGRRATRAWQAETRRKATGQASIDKCGNV